jgi:hypothetical protein
MRIVVRGAGAVVALVAALLASGCAPSDPQPTPEPSPSATPLFESDEEALAAAEEAYAAYQQAFDSILIDGGVRPERLLEVATPEQYEYEKAGFDEAFAKGYRSTGGSKFDSMRLQEYEPAGRGVTLSVYVCDDYSAVDIFDSSGATIVPETRPDRYPRVVSFAAAPDSDLEIGVSRIVEWTGDSFC